MQSDRLRRILEEKRKNHKLSVRGLAQRSGVNHSQVSRLLSGQTRATTSILEKLCSGLECSREEKVAIFHAAGYLAPEESEELEMTA